MNYVRNVSLVQTGSHWLQRRYPAPPAGHCSSLGWLGRCSRRSSPKRGWHPAPVDDPPDWTGSQLHKEDGMEWITLHRSRQWTKYMCSHPSMLSAHTIEYWHEQVHYLVKIMATHTNSPGWLTRLPKGIDQGVPLRPGWVEEGLVLVQCHLQVHNG